MIAQVGLPSIVVPYPALVCVGQFVAAIVRFQSRITCVVFRRSQRI